MALTGRSEDAFRYGGVCGIRWSIRWVGRWLGSWWGLLPGAGGGRTGVVCEKGIKDVERERKDIGIREWYMWFLY